MTDADLPPLYAAILDEGTLDQLFFDLEQGAEILRVVFKSKAETADAAAPDLRAAHRALVEGRVLGVQIRYRFQGREWWDTLVRGAAGTRLVRVAQG